MPSEWYNGGDWDGLPIRRLAHVAADLVREAERRRDGNPMHPYSDDPADYDGWPVSEMAGVAQAALEWLRSECDDYAYPDFWNDPTEVAYPESVWAYVQGEDSTDVVTEEYLGIDGLTVDGQRMTGQIWHTLRRAVERLRWQMRLITNLPLDRYSPPTATVKNAVNSTVVEVFEADAATAASSLNSAIWPTPGSYGDGAAGIGVEWLSDMFGYSPFSGRGFNNITVLRVRSRIDDLSYFDELVRFGVTHCLSPLGSPGIEFYAQGGGPYAPGADRAVIWQGSVPTFLSCEASYTDGRPVTFSAPSGTLTRSGTNPVTIISALVVRDMEHDPAS
jgi:hypothetical protein